jgi:hypothetical protein
MGDYGASQEGRSQRENGKLLLAFWHDFLFDLQQMYLLYKSFLRNQI